MNTQNPPPFNVESPDVQQACRVIARLLMGDMGKKQARRTVLAIMIAATADSHSFRRISDPATRRSSTE